jgi:hypothetical protein
VWIFLWHAVLWVPKLIFYIVQRMALWSGTLYLFRKGKYSKVYYFLSAALYITSWVLIILLVRQTFALKFSQFPSLFASALRKIS